MPTRVPDPVVVFLRQDFRHHLAQFYTFLNLAPPYESVEKAIRLLSSAYDRHSPQEQQYLLDDDNRKWKFYEEVFIESGLVQKHRGIIRGLINSGRTASLPTPYSHFIRPFTSQTKRRFEPF